MRHCGVACTYLTALAFLFKKVPAVCNKTFLLIGLCISLQKFITTTLEKVLSLISFEKPIILLRRERAFLPINTVYYFLQPVLGPGILKTAE